MILDWLMLTIILDKGKILDRIKFIQKMKKEKNVMNKKGRKILVSALGAAFIATAPVQAHAENATDKAADASIEVAASEQQQETEEVTGTEVISETENASLKNAAYETEEVETTVETKIQSGDSGEAQTQELTPGWKTETDGSMKYVDENGEYVVSVFKEIDGAIYYFNESGVMLKGCVEQIDNKYYGFDFDGKMFDDASFYFWLKDENGNSVSRYFRAQVGGELYIDSWYEDTDGNRYYYDESGYRAESEVKKIDGSYYGFASDGKMYSNTQFYIPKPNGAGGWNYTYYRAKADGTLYVNSWYEETEYNIKYYYGEEGVGLEGLNTVDGVLYYFYNGRLIRNTVMSIDGAYYILTEDGHAVETPNNAWTNVNGYYYYVKDGQCLLNCVEKIGDAYYYFDAYGRMLDNMSVRAGTYGADGSWTYSSYRAKVGGALYVNEWCCVQENGRTIYYYYGEKGVGACGLVTVNGVQYYFDEMGRMLTNCVTETDEGVYISRKDGTAVQAQNNAWTYVEGHYYYVKDNKVLKNCVDQINGAYYGFDDEGWMYDDEEFYISGIKQDGDRQNFYYRAKKGGALYVNEWYADEEEWHDTTYYYYGEEGVAPNGLYEVNGVTYYFNDGYMYVDRVVRVDDKFYICSSSGTLVEIKNNTWTYVEGYYYYVKDNELLEECVEKIGDYYYGFDDEGRMYNNEEFSLYDDDEDKWNNYYAQAGGALYTNGWYKETASMSTYYYYYGADGKAYTGVQNVNGVMYYFNEYNGNLVSNTAVKQDGKLYVSDKDGVAHEIEGDNRWVQYDGIYYYVKDGDFLKGTVAQINGSYFLFDYSGHMYNDAVVNIYNEDGRKVYRVRKGGFLYVNEWYINGNEKYYYGENGVGASGICIIDGIVYYFDSDSRVRTGYAFEADGKAYISDKQGVSHEIEGDNKWVQYDGTYYYLKDGHFLKECVEKIDGNYFGFDSAGQMYNNRSFSVSFQDEIGSWWTGYYRAKSGGFLYTDTWYKSENEWNAPYYYYGSDGAAYTGMKDVGGTMYYFKDYNGELITSEAYLYDGKAYVSDANGNVHEIEGDNKWIQYDGIYFYLKDGEFLKDCVEKIGDSYFGFNDNGVMYDNAEFGIGYNDENGNWVHKSYYAQAGGTLYTNRWYSDGWDWESGKRRYVYYGDDGAIVTGLHTINGVMYYFNLDGQMVYNYSFTNDGKAYVSDGNGNAHEITGVDKWVQYDGIYYYLKDGQFMKDCVEKINNVSYGFDGSGRMRTNGIFFIVGEDGTSISYAADANGALIINGWEDNWYSNSYFFGEDGRGYTGMKVINNKQYYFSGGELQTNCIVTYNDVNYRCSLDGLLTELQNNAWTLVDGHWYYVEDGTVLRQCVRKIGINTFVFNSDGKLASYGRQYVFIGNEIVAVGANTDGTLLTNQWINFKLDEGKEAVYAYAGSDGKLYNGLQTINGKQYYFSDYIMMKNRAVKDYQQDGKLYLVDAAGIASEVSGTGWKQLGADYYYVDGDFFITGNIQYINGRYYGFDYNGKCIETGLVEGNLDDGLYGRYYIQADGSLLKNGTWTDAKGQVYYFDADGCSYNGWKVIDGKKYYFSLGLIMKNEIAYEDNVACILRANGEVHDAIDGQWNYVDGYYYYLINGQGCADEIVTINGVLYAFDEYGRMRANTIAVVYNEGDAAVCCATASGALVTGWYTDSTGTTYYFGKDGIGYDGLHYIDGKLYQFKCGKLV